MRRLPLREFDLKVRVGGLALLVLAAILFTQLPGQRNGHAVARPSMAEFCIAFVAVCATSAGASFVLLGRQMLDPVPDRRGRRLAGSEPGDAVASSGAATARADFTRATRPTRQIDLEP